jgi:hypothetical protein
MLCKSEPAAGQSPGVVLSYNCRMGKRAISITLDNGNLLWLQARAQQAGVRSISELVDQLVTNARITESGPVGTPRSIVGTVKIVDPTLFEEEQDWPSTDRPRAMPFRERSVPPRPSRRKPSRG